MFDHINLTVRYFAKAKAFYETALAPLGFKVTAPGDDKTYCGMGVGQSIFWLEVPKDPNVIPTPIHIAFVGKNKEEVQAFYDAAIAAGGKDNGAPGYHTEYGGGHYAGFVFDPEGNNIEVVYRDMAKY